MIAEIIMNSSVRNLDRTFDYSIPIDMEEKVHIGSRVLVKFGNIKELKEGFVINIKEKSEFEVKDIAKVHMDRLPLTSLFFLPCPAIF